MVLGGAIYFHISHIFLQCIMLYFEHPALLVHVHDRVRLLYGLCTPVLNIYSYSVLVFVIAFQVADDKVSIFIVQNGHGLSAVGINTESMQLHLPCIIYYLVSLHVYFMLSKNT